MKLLYWDCWAHVGRRFYEIAKSGPAPIASDSLQRIAAHYAIEAKIRGHNPALVDAIRDWGDGWSDISLTEQLVGCRDFIERSNTLLERGYRRQIGAYRALHLSGNGKRLPIKILLITFLPKDHPGRCAMITLPPNIETHAEDRISVSE